MFPHIKCYHPQFLNKHSCPMSRILVFFVRKVDSCIFHSVDKHPSINACQQIYFWDSIAADKRIAFIGNVCIFSCHKWSWFTMMLTVLDRVLLSSRWFFSASIDSNSFWLACILLHRSTCILYSISLQRGHTSNSLYFHCFIFSPMPQRPDICFIIYIWRSNGSNVHACLMTSRFIFSFSSAGNCPYVFP